MSRPIDRREFLGAAVAIGAGWALLPRLVEAKDGGGGDGVWLAGDLHTHTTYSHDVWSGPGDDNTPASDFYTLGWSPAEQIAIAEARLLDYLAITDHDDVRALADPGYRSSRLTLIPGYEHSLSRGHAGCLGVTSRFTGIATGTDEGALALRDAVHDAGGLFILNHPFYGSGWRYSPLVRPDAVEVWNIGWPYRREIFGFTNTSENYKSLPYWEESFLASGRMPATGGSDNHWRSTTAIQGAGQPC
ncbi:MAG TPA: CehA/McbA family metallohydrolase, partial [Vitreimonas sp.]|nr:CehA/McbA family metallohydrolase [Vitreimonas sp.]